MTKDYSFQWEYICGHKTKLATSKIVITNPENIIGEYLYCEKCNDFQRVIRLTLLDNSTLKTIPKEVQRL